MFYFEDEGCPVCGGRVAFDKRAVDICDSPMLLGLGPIDEEGEKGQEEQGREAVHSVAGCRGSLDGWRRMGLGFGEAESRAGGKINGAAMGQTGRHKSVNGKWEAIVREGLAYWCRW